ncbi:hypothetical protein C0Q70_04476 [Pomacea canaliculata]|uniref:Signal peptide, CUB and EGF-like domain-containing protein 1 n=1 Tax=Pomacea canaliculata TaxID=400727 RepID=A0A2T7PIH2_POMCA|nr:hypothetical protein C0Q70_04476 [Pomacea canaliculata]
MASRPACGRWSSRTPSPVTTATAAPPTTQPKLTYTTGSSVSMATASLVTRIPPSEGATFMHVTDDVVKKGSRLQVDVSAERVEVLTPRGVALQEMESPFLLNVSGRQPQAEGAGGHDLYVGLNRGVNSHQPSGSGLCQVEISLYEFAKDCERGTHNCHKDAECLTSRKTYRCKCKDGFYGDGKICVDDDECKFENGGCAHTCHNTPGNFTCSCYPGFVLTNDGLDCIDLNECLENRGGCSQQCVNTVGSYLCRCDAGYSLHEDGRTCVKTCSIGNGGCQHVCKDTPTGTQCSCAPKYILASDRVACIASCAVKNGGCEKKCRDTPTGPVCSCPAGYQLHQDGRSCLDIDECQKDKGGCSHQCVNNHGSYECVCPSGHKVGLDQSTCTDIDECAVKDSCDHECTNLPGSYLCTCKPGYQQYGLTHCADIDECSVQNGGCQHNCTNTEGSYRCSCAPNYKLHPNGRDCVDADQCLPLREVPMSVLQCSPPDPRRKQQRCTLRCQPKARFTSLPGNEVVLTCSSASNYQWRVEGANTSIPACSEKEAAMSYKRRARLAFIVKRCEVRNSSVEELKTSLAATLEGQKKYRCENSCQVNYVNITCGTQVSKLKRLVRGTPDELVTAEVEIQMNSHQPTGKCGANCMAARTLKRFKRSFKKLKKGIRQNKFEIKFEARQYKVLRKSFNPDKKVEEACEAGFILVNKTCVACSAGTFYDAASGTCSPCPAGSYQNKEGKLNCKSCDQDYITGPPGASSRKQCTDLCAPGYYSANGSVPCVPCPAGTFQPQAGRTSCTPCGPQLTTSRAAASSFAHCRAKERCPAGHFYEVSEGVCKVCPVGTYQTDSEQNFCVACPGTTTTDNTASTSPEDCKDRTCGKFDGEYFGVIQSPNYPGNYPNNVNCVWTIKPEKNRRILIIVPDIALSDDSKCGDVLVMRKSKSPYSRVTFETCGSLTTPTAFTARSSKLWIQFRSDGNNTAGGFSIPFVTYNEEYQSLIEDIVKDGRLYSSYQHQQIFKDRLLLHALLEVIATPYNYLKYANVSRSMFPHSFFKLLTPKVRRFFYS